MHKLFTKAIISSVLVAVLLTLASCGGNKKRFLIEIKPEGELYAIAMQRFDAGDWSAAIATFDRFERLYINSDNIRDVRLRRADAYFNKNNSSGYITARAEYKSFVSLYPRYENLDYIWKQIGISSFKLLLPPNRDQSYTYEAVEDFKEFLKRYPDSEFVPEIRQYLQQSYTRISNQHILIGKHYYRRGIYHSAAERFKAALEQNVEIKNLEEILYLLGNSLARGSDYYSKLHGFYSRTKQEDFVNRYKNLHERYLYEAKQIVIELEEKFPGSRQRQAEIQRLINLVIPIKSDLTTTDNN